MKSHIFHRKYANTPLPDRVKIITYDRYGCTINPITLSEIYQRVKDIEDKIRPDIIELEKLLDRAEEYYNKPKTPYEEIC